MMKGARHEYAQRESQPAAQIPFDKCLKGSGIFLGTIISTQNARTNEREIL